MLRSHFLLAPFVALFGLKRDETPPDMPIVGTAAVDPDWMARLVRQRRLVAERRIVETVTEDRSTEGDERWTPQFHGLPDDALSISADRNWQHETHQIRWVHESFDPTERGRIPIWDPNLKAAIRYRNSIVQGADGIAFLTTDEVRVAYPMWPPHL